MLRKSLCILTLMFTVSPSALAAEVDQATILRCNVYNSDGEGNKIPYPSPRTNFELNNELDAGTVAISRHQLAISFIPSGASQRVTLKYNFQGVPKKVDGFSVLKVGKTEVKYKENLYLVKEGFINWSLLKCQNLEEYENDPNNQPLPVDFDHDRAILRERNEVGSSEVR